MNALSQMEYSPDTDTEHWCATCDVNAVKSNDKTTGKFFAVSGHTYSLVNHRFDGDYKKVMFAICTNCLSN